MLFVCSCVRKITKCYSTMSNSDKGMPTRIETMRLSCAVYEIQQAVCRKLPILPTQLHLASSMGVNVFEFQDRLWQQKTRLSGLPRGLFSLSGIQPFWYNTGLWQTDRQTQDDNIYRAIRCRAVKFQQWWRQLFYYSWMVTSNVAATVPGFASL